MTNIQAPLAGLRIIESSILGPAAITTAFADLGAEIIKVETPAGDYIREMTWPIIEGVSLMHYHLNRGKRGITLDLRLETAREVYRDLVKGAEVVIRRSEADQSAYRLLHGIRLRYDGTVQGHAFARHCLRYLGGSRDARLR